MAVKDEPNPYVSPPATDSISRNESATSSVLTDNDLKDLRVGSRRAREHAARFEPYVLPVFAFLIATYQFWMCWSISQDSATPFLQLIAQDAAGFPADVYDGDFVRMFDRFVTGFCALIIAGFVYLMGRSERKRQLQNHRFHTAMLNAGLVPPDPSSADKHNGG